MPKIDCTTPAQGRPVGGESLAAPASSGAGLCSGSKWQHVHALAQRILHAPEFRDDIKPVDLASILDTPEAERFANHWNSLTPGQRMTLTLSTAALGARIARTIIEKKAAEATERGAAAPGASAASESKVPDGNHGDNLRSAEK